MLLCTLFPTKMMRICKRVTQIKKKFSLVYSKDDVLDGAQMDNRFFFL